MSIYDTSQRVRSMHDLKIRVDGGEDQKLQDFSVPDAGVYFRDLPERLTALIKSYDYVIGCVAWLTHPMILEALASRKLVSIVIQKEDFLRPDQAGYFSRFGASLRDMYDALPHGERFDLPGMAQSLSVCSDPGFEPVRCVGNHNRERKPAHPRSHHKFLVFCRNEEHPTDCPDCAVAADRAERLDAGTNLFTHLWRPKHACCETFSRLNLVPEAVWTGSFNFTINGGESFENALVLRDPRVCEAYVNEWAQIFALSEPLDWSSDWASPEWRLGT